MTQPDISLRSPQAIATETAHFMSQVYLWMTVGVGLSGGIAYTIGNNPEMMTTLLQTPGLFPGLMITEVVAVMGLIFLAKRISAAVATLLYLAYAVLTGCTLSVLFMAYTHESITQVFGLTSFAFLGLSSFGYLTKRDLGPVGSFCMMGLFGLVGFSILSLFFPSMMSSTAEKTYSLCGIIVFAGLTAYDTQKIKGMAGVGTAGSAEERKGAIYGALTLYLDFVNLFLSMLRLTGRRK